MLKRRKRMWFAILLLLAMVGPAACEIVDITHTYTDSYTFSEITVTASIGTEVDTMVEYPEADYPYGLCEVHFYPPSSQTVTGGSGGYGSVKWKVVFGYNYMKSDDYILTAYNVSNPGDNKSVVVPFRGEDRPNVNCFVLYVPNPGIAEVRVGDIAYVRISIEDPYGWDDITSVTVDLTDFGLGSEVAVNKITRPDHTGNFIHFYSEDLVIPDVPFLRISMVAIDKNGAPLIEERNVTVHPAALKPTPTPTPKPTPTATSTPVPTSMSTPTPTPASKPTPVTTVIETPEEVAVESEEVEDTVDEPTTDETRPVQVELEIEVVSIPGFTARFAIHGLLMIAALLRYRRNQS